MSMGFTENYLRLNMYSGVLIGLGRETRSFDDEGSYSHTNQYFPVLFLICSPFIMGDLFKTLEYILSLLSINLNPKT